MTAARKGLGRRGASEVRVKGSERSGGSIEGDVKLSHLIIRQNKCRKARNVEEVARELGQKLGRAATEEEVAEALNLSPVELSRLMDEVHGTALLSLSKSVSSDEDQDFIQLEDIVDDPAHKDALDQIETEEACEVLLQTIDGLPEQQRLVVALYYYEEMTLKEIGEALHISESRVSQIHSRAVKTLKGRLGRLL